MEGTFGKTPNKIIHNMYNYFIKTQENIHKDQAKAITNYKNKYPKKRDQQGPQ